MAEAMDVYFAECIASGRTSTILGLCLHLDLTTQGLREYEEKPLFSSLVKKARMRVGVNHEENLQSGRPCAGSIYWLKVQEGWKEPDEGEDAGRAALLDLLGKFVFDKAGK